MIFYAKQGKIRVVILMNNDFIITKIFRIVLVDKDEYPQSFLSFGKRNINKELIFHFSGDETVYFDDEILHTKANIIRFLPKGYVDKYIVERREKGECIMVSFDSSCPISDKAFAKDIPNATVIGNLFKKLFSVWVAKNEGYYFECMSILYNIFSEMQKNNYIPESQLSIIKPAVNYIEQNFLDGKISVNHLAKISGISESYLKKLFIKKFGMPPSKYIIQLKLNHACDLLRFDTYKISHISNICGYDNVYYFSRQFKKHIGITPSEFRKKYKSSK